MTPAEDAGYRRLVCVLLSIGLHSSAGILLAGVLGISAGPRRHARLLRQAGEESTAFYYRPASPAEPVKPPSRAPKDPSRRRVSMQRPEQRSEPAPEPIDLEPVRQEMRRQVRQLSRRARSSARTLDRWSEQLASAIPEALGEPAPQQPRPPASKPEPPEPATGEKPVAEKAATPAAREPVETREPPSPAGSDRPRGVSRQARSKVGIDPEYPRASIRRGHEGTVIVEADVSPRGEVLAARVVESSGHARLDAAAVEAVKQARFIPAMQDGQGVADTVRVPIRFRLRG